MGWCKFLTEPEICAGSRAKPEIWASPEGQSGLRGQNSISSLHKLLSNIVH